MSDFFAYYVNTGNSPFWSFAIHDGSRINPVLKDYLNLNDAERFREEDPYTGTIAELPINKFIVSTSRFQLDMNRTIADAIYLRPEQAWGLSVWENLPEPHIATLQNEHHNVFKEIETLIQRTIDDHGYFVVLDIHSYNCKRSGPLEEVDHNANPQINLGTIYNHPKWRSLIQYFITSIQHQTYFSQPIDIRENVKFKGGYLSQFINKKFGDKGCVLSIEFRKDFMDEWTGEPYIQHIMAYRQILMNALTDLQEYNFNDARG
ncbi:N-formylglutamate amidohydrolase [Sphingobacterium lumbrici]|uniref:N-formylglutamate amidohydrolase n=1 Tax=Sphingobacterium lumbrici TaxID=2559600 RepID=UPI00112CC43F|nr:N-formylglutamate amidohydrolase [Sphingobacterium lumbrici]